MGSSSPFCTLPVRAGWKGCSNICGKPLGAGILTGEEEAEFAFGGACLKVRQQLQRGSLQEFLKMFGQLTGHADLARGINGIQGFQSFQDAVGRFVKNGGVGKGKGFSEDAGASSGFVGEKATKIERGCVKAGAHQSRDCGAGTGQDFDRKSGEARLADQPGAGVGDRGCAGITDKSHVKSFPHALNEVRCTGCLIVLMQAGLGFGDPVVFEEDARVACVFRSHKIAGMQGFQSPESDVAKVPDGGWNDGEHVLLPTFGELRHDLDGSILGGHGNSLTFCGLEIFA